MSAALFFAPSGTRPAAGLFSHSHLLLLLLTLAGILLALRCSRRMHARERDRTVALSTAVLWVLELAKILFVLLVERSTNPNAFVPLYFCSLILYAGLLYTCFDGKLRHTGAVFIGTGGLVGGAVYLLFPTTSLFQYPAFHFISCHSFFLHGLMVYLGLLLLWRGGYTPHLGDLCHAAALIGTMCAAALAFNTVYDRLTGTAVANLMFLSKDFGTGPLSLLYRLCGPLFTPVMCVGQAILPFLLVWGEYWLVARHMRHPKRRE